MKTIQINAVSIPIKEWNSQRVVSFKDIDLVHERPEGTARKAFNRNRKHLVENEDYFIIKPKTLENAYLGIKCPFGISSVAPRGTTFVTESGYLMLVKVFEDDLAWEVQKRLVNNYFKMKDIVNEHIAMSQLTEILSSIDTRLTKLEKNQEIAPQIEVTYKKPYNPWFAKMQPKYKLLEEYFDKRCHAHL